MAAAAIAALGEVIVLPHAVTVANPTNDSKPKIFLLSITVSSLFIKWSNVGRQFRRTLKDTVLLISVGGQGCPKLSLRAQNQVVRLLVCASFSRIKTSTPNVAAGWHGVTGLSYEGPGLEMQPSHSLARSHREAPTKKFSLWKDSAVSNR